MTTTHPAHRLLFLTSLLWLFGCEPPLDTRTALIIQTLIDADRDLIASRPALVRTKYALMATGLQPFLRGTAALFYRDLARYQHEEADVPHGAGAEQIQLYGDVHLENIGVTFDKEGALLDVIDFDATVRGPFGWEVRRAALALREALATGGVSNEILDEVTRRFSQSYVHTVVELRDSPTTPPAVVREQSTSSGRIITDLIADGRKRNDQQEEISEYTAVESGVRRIVRTDDMVSLPDPWLQDLPQLIDSYRKTRHAGAGEEQYFEVLDAVQRFNSGVASLPNLRFWVLLKGPTGTGPTMTEAPAWLLEFKEERDPPQPTAWLGRGPVGGNNGQRVFAGTLALLATPTAEADLGYVSWGGVSFQVRRVLRGRRDLDVAKLSDRIQSGRYGNADLFDLATTIGRLLATGHARAGHAGAIAEVLLPNGIDPETFITNLVRSAATDQQRLTRDLSLFQHALELRGPLLGARTN